MNKHIVIVGGGTLSEQFLPEIKKANCVIGVDHGAAWLIAHGITPNIAIGDFDSVTKEELARIKQSVKIVMVHPAEKDFTDMELAVAEAIKLKPKKVIIYGGIGMRIDHTLGTMHLLERFLRAGVDAIIKNETNAMMLLDRQRTVQKNPEHRYISLLPYTDAATVSLRGFLYNVKNVVIRRGMTLGISNEFVGDTGIIDVHEGIVLVIQSKD